MRKNEQGTRIMACSRFLIIKLAKSWDCKRDIKLRVLNNFDGYDYYVLGWKDDGEKV